MKPSSRPRRTDRREAEQVGDSTSDLLHLGKEVVTDAGQFVPRFLSSFVQRSPPVSGCPSALPRAHVEVGLAPGLDHLLSASSSFSFARASQLKASHRPRPASSASRSASAGSWDAGTPFTPRARRSGHPAARPGWPAPRTRWVGPPRGLPPARRELPGNRRRRVASGGLLRAEGRVRPRAVPGAGPASAAGPFPKPGRARPPAPPPRPHAPTPPRRKLHQPRWRRPRPSGPQEA